MWSWFKKRTAIGVGLDIGAHGISLLALRWVDANIYLDGYAIEPLLFVGDQQKEGVSSAIQRARQRIPVSFDQVAIAVSDDVVITKLIELPAGLNEYDIELQLAATVDRYLSYPYQDAYLDFEVLNETTDNQLNVKMAAVRRSVIDPLLNIMKLAKLKVVLVDVESNIIAYAMQKMLIKGSEYADPVVAVIEVNFNATTFYVFKEGRIFFSHTDYHEEEADVEKVTLRIRRALQYFSMVSHDGEIHRLFLMGDLTKCVGVTEWVADQLNIATQLADPFLNMSIEPAIDRVQLMQHAPLLIKSFGLAMRCLGNEIT